MLGTGAVTISSNPALIPATMPDDGSTVFPVVLVLDEAAGVNWEGGAASFIDRLSAGATDLQVTQADGETTVPFDVAQLVQTPGSRKLVVHMGVPTLDAAAATEYMLHSGVAGGPFAAPHDVWPAADAWVGRYGMEATTGAIVDSTAAGNDAAREGTPSAVTGQVGQAQELARTADYFDPAVISPFDDASALTFGVWTYPFSSADYQHFYTMYHSLYRRIHLYLTPANIIRIELGLRSPAHVQSSGDGTAVTDNAWSHVVIQWDGHYLRRYLNGVATGSVDFTGVATTIDARDIAPVVGGVRTPRVCEGRFDGRLDEITMLTRALSADWIATTYNAEADNDTFWTVGAFVSAAARYPAARRSRIYRLGPRLTHMGVI